MAPRNPTDGYTTYDPSRRGTTSGQQNPSRPHQNVNYKGDRAYDPRRRMGRSQYDNLAHAMNSGEGFSRQTAGRPGAPATDAYMVAGYAPEGHLPTPVTGEGLEQYATEHAEALAPENRYLGGWGSSVDVSQAFPRNSRGATVNGIPSAEQLKSLLGATYTGILHGQDAIGEVNRSGGYVRDIPTAHGMAAPAMREVHPPGEEPYSEVDESLSYRTPANRALRAARPQ